MAAAKPGSVRFGVELRARKAAEKLRKKEGPSPEAQAAFPGLTRGPEPTPAPAGGNFVSGALNRAEAAAQGGPPPADVPLGAVEPGVPVQPVDPFQQTATGGMGYAGALQQAQLADAARGSRQVRVDNTAQHEAVAALNEEERRLGIEGADTAEEAFRTQESMALESAQLAEEAQQTYARTAAREQIMASEQAQKRDDIETDVAQYATAADAAAAEFAKVEAFDPGAAWADKGAGQKVRMMLAAFGRGLTGGNPADILTETVQRELAAHKQVRSDAAEKLQGARAGMTNARQTMQTFLAMTGDERVADALVEKKTLAGIRAKMDAKEAEFGPKILTDQWQATDLALQQKMAETDFKIYQRAAAAPKYFTKTVRTDSMGAAERAVRAKMSGQMVDTAGEAMKQRGTSQAAALKESATDSRGLSKRDHEDLRQYSMNADVAKQEGVVRLIKGVLAPTDIKGAGGISADIWGDDPRNLNSKLEKISTALARAESGGAITEDEFTLYTGMLDKGVMAGGGESRLRQNLIDVQEMVESKLETPRRFLSQEARSYIDRQDNPDFVGETQKAGRGRKRVQAADGSVITDRSEFE